QSRGEILLTQPITAVETKAAHYYLDAEIVSRKREESSSPEMQPLSQHLGNSPGEERRRACHRLPGARARLDARGSGACVRSQFGPQEVRICHAALRPAV